MTEYERMVIVAGTQWSTFRFARNPTAADLLSDPRVAAVVRALRRSDPTSGALHDEKAEALAPWAPEGKEP